jgi:mono/diheme cytochrome c family protein
VKAIVTAFAVCISFLAVSIALGQNGNSDNSSTGPAPQYDPAIYAELQKAPDKARNRKNPLQNDLDAVAAGGIFFGQHCAECHGDAGQGGKKGPSLRVAEVQSATPGAIFWVLTNGVVRKGMPVWSKLPEPQRWQLVRYIQSLGGPGPATEPPAPKP